MGNKQTTQIPLDLIKFDRVIDGEEQVYIGIVPKKQDFLHILHNAYELEIV